MVGSNFDTAHGTSALISVRDASIFAHTQGSTHVVEDFDQRGSANQRCDTASAHAEVAAPGYLRFGRGRPPQMEICQELPLLGPQAQSAGCSGGV